MNKEEIKQIKEDYNNGRYEKTPRGFEDWITRNGYSERLSNSDSIDAEDRISIADNAGLDLQAPQGESRRRQSNQNSQENLGTG